MCDCNCASVQFSFSLKSNDFIYNKDTSSLTNRYSKEMYADVAGCHNAYANN